MHEIGAARATDTRTNCVRPIFDMAHYPDGGCVRLLTADKGKVKVCDDAFKECPNAMHGKSALTKMVEKRMPTVSFVVDILFHPSSNLPPSVDQSSPNSRV